MTPETIGAAALTGLATGSRSFTGLAAVAFAAPREAQAQPDRILGRPGTKTAIGAVALQEWVMDKLPNTPSRLEAVGLIARAAAAGASGAILARRAQVDAAARVGAPSSVEYALSPVHAPGEPTEPPAPDWTAIAACAATSAVAALGSAVIGARLRGWSAGLFGHDWPAAALEDAASAGLAAATVYVSRAAHDRPVSG